MNATAPSSSDQVGVALTCSLIAAVGYTATNVCLRSVVALDPIWVSCIKAIPMLGMVVPWIGYRVWSGQSIVRHGTDMAILAATGSLGQVIGNAMFQVSLQYAGLAIAVPVTLGTLIFLGAIFGRWLLGDHLAPAKLWAGVVLVVAIVILAQGARQAATLGLSRGAGGTASFVPGGVPDEWLPLIGVVAAILGAMAYSLLGVAIRYTGRRGMPLATTLGIVSIVGVFWLSLITWYRFGTNPLTDTTTVEWRIMLAAGALNAIAFCCFSKALHCSSIFFVNGVNATQTGMAAIAGIWLFREPLSIWLGLGVTLTTVGLVMMSRRG